MSLEWLKDRVPAIGALRPVELDAIRDFTLLWSLFEARVLDQEANAARLSDLVEEWDRDGALDAEPYGAAFAYFQDRYFAGGVPTAHYRGLKLRRQDREVQLRAALDGSDATPRGRTLAVFLILYRFRNNLFHGAKWESGLAEQLDNFTHANGALVTSLDRYGDF